MGLRSTAARVLVGVALLVVAGVLFAVLQGGTDDGRDSGGAATSEPGKPAIATVVVSDGRPVGGVADLSFAAGERIRFLVKSDVSDEIHVHGYDVAEDVEAGGSVGFDFEATIEGVFEIELEHRGEQIAELRVSP